MIKAMPAEPWGRRACVPASRLHAWSRFPACDPILIVAVEKQGHAPRLPHEWHIPRLPGFITVLLLSIGGLDQRGSGRAGARLQSRTEGGSRAGYRETLSAGRPLRRAPITATPSKSVTVLVDELL